MKKIRIDDKDLRLLEELKCKANELIKTNNFTTSLLSTAIQADTDFYYKFVDVEDKKDQINKNYKNIGFIKLMFYQKECLIEEIYYYLFYLMQ